MINPFKLPKQLSNLKDLQSQAKKMQEELSKEEIRIESGDFVVVVNGNQEVKQFSVQGVSSPEAVKVLNEALKKSKEVGAKKVQEMMGGMPGMGSLKKMMGQ